MLPSRILSLLSLLYGKSITHHSYLLDYQRLARWRRDPIADTSATAAAEKVLCRLRINQHQ